MAGREQGQPAKRLRGHALDLARGAAEQKERVESGESSLATGLLSLWAHGNIAATTMCWLAHLATLDGVEHVEVVALAKAGNFGQVPGDCARDVTRRFCSASRVPEPLQVPIPVLDRTTNKDSTEDAGIMLPHMVFSTLATGYPAIFESLGLHKLEAFWNSALATGDDRLENVPALKGRDWKRKVVPLFVHGDGVEYQTRDSLMVWSFGSLLSLFSDSLMKHFLMAMFPKIATSASTWPAIMKWLVWSFDALAKGYHPQKGPENEPLTKGSVFEKLKGQPLTPGHHKGIIWSLQGDHDFFSNVVGLPHWQSHYPCWECDASLKEEAARHGKWVKEIEQDKQNFVRVTSKQAARLSMFTNPKTPWAVTPFLECKGAENKHLLKPLATVAGKLLDTTEPVQCSMLSALECMSDLVEVFDAADMFLADNEFRKAESLAKGFLDSYSFLNQWPLEKGYPGFRIVMKHHTFQHLVENSRFLNPRAHWCFASEDFVGRVSRLAKSASSGVRSTRLSVKSMHKYRILMHLLMTRPSIHDVVPELDGMADEF
ncbi:unnamed protein product [Symbiodinium sp. CCMP2592]|nr:unnamed protein product [Symbiodinium sp. CCMP2592]